MKTRRENGISLLEVLVSIFVLSFGVIGAVGMQLTAMRTAQESAFHTAALQLATEMAEKMRANTEQMKLGDEENPFIAVDYAPTGEAEPGVPGKLCYSTHCDSAELADFDIYEWKKRINALLPHSRARICRDAAWDAAQAQLTWACHPGSGNSGPYVIKLGWRMKDPDGRFGAGADKDFPPAVAVIVEPYFQ
ncbi:type IV pilus modification protein PilV [Noviherbaspirillum massiliense]|uniref:type IV pilus modification protein PilV n=1 Tax=Noviherbaspirillum massiliense TaxID=1465823 RepID=UPI000304CE05|nr:type IV pilus modification protein PilV [Noviherbaspirillum massiliense]